MRDRVRHIHLVGIGGSGMSGIAEVLLNQGYRVSGSDLGLSAAAERLQALGAQVQRGHAASNIDGADVVVVSTAVPPDNVEITAARARGVPVVPRATMLAELMRLKDGIAIAGTHGKTTTTSLVAHLLAQGGLDPTFIIGGRVNALGSGARVGAGRYLVVEADESDASFLHLNPILAVVTNIDQDHMDTYGGDPARLRQAFVEFLQRLPFYGLAVLCQDDAGLMALRPQIGRSVVTYGLRPDADLHADEVTQDGLRMHFTARAAGRAPLAVTLNLPGLHNVQNALAAIAIAREVGVDDAAIARGLASFEGIGRRLQHLADGALDGKHLTLIDDYGHHPRELQATLDAVRGAYPGRRLLTVFQPHRYTRTRDLLDDFAAVLSAGTDALLLCEVYAAGEAPIAGADGRALARAIRGRGRIEPVFVEHIADLPHSLAAVLQDGDVVLTLGAGSIGQAAAALASRLAGAA
ncbi:UDP-N-acetylmuramate--L-alanine ligase [Immundisolibacter sp.]|uniref:UDP-N-acetylmuramate--L-alanine ligase n=1 Tax=Immundisolibacter sp. TaxID=1934948 RepID=UPI002B0991AA|nr:UDP-N-acetylmuramate--L-alanine ligase [Immundisolibacter sp.]MEA3220093.1 UDP-N-acetylmuramate--L-alanine ligase [Immundisolibacter sp.]